MTCATDAVDANIRRRYRLFFPRICSAIFCVLAVGCNQQESISSAISKLNLTDSAGVPVASALNISTDTYVCVLEPYVSRLNASTNFSDAVNAFLAARDYRGSEGHWTFIYGRVESWALEEVRRQQVELLPLLADDGRKLDFICGQANAIQLIKPTQGKVNFKKVEKK
jgi:hypothetical protein